NDVSVPETTLRRGALLDSAPIFSAQALGSTKALVQFADGIDAPSHIVDLASGKTRQVAAGRVAVLDANERFATVRIDRVYRLDLATAGLVPVEPPEGDPQRGFAAAGYYVYSGIDGKLNALATGEQTAASFDESTGARFAPAGGSATADAPGWITVPALEACDNAFRLSSLVNPSLRVVSRAFSLAW